MIHDIDEERARLYWDIILAHLPELVRQTLESRMQGYKYQSEFARKYYGQGHEKGREEGREEGREGLLRAVLGLASAKVSTLPGGLESKLRAIYDLDTLGLLIVALGQADNETAALAVLDAAVRAHSSS